MGIPKFKVGDRVRLMPDYIRELPQGTKIGEVVGFDDDYILVSYTNCIYKEGFPYAAEEIESAVKVGQQLLFDFMSKE